MNFSAQNMWVLNISFKLLIVVILTFTKAQADSSACQRKEKHFAALDLAKDAIFKAKDLQPSCVIDSKNISSNASECDVKEKVSAYLDFALSLIDNAKENFLTCDETKNITKDVTDESKNITKDVTDDGKEITKVVLHKYPIDCSEVLENGENKSGEYVIWPKNPQFTNLQLKVYCDMDTEGGGWTVIQRRGNFSNKVDFYRNWSDYKQGFGNISEEFWIGNDNIFALTNQGNYTVRFDMENVKKEYRYATYSSFRIEDEKAVYKVHFNKYNGTAGDGIDVINNMPFATKDKDNGKSSTAPCADERMGGWWYNNCGLSNPNGRNLPGGKGNVKNMNWYPWTEYASLLTIEIKIRSENLKI